VGAFHGKVGGLLRGEQGVNGICLQTGENSIFQDISRCTGKDCCRVLGFICSVGIRAHWKHCVCNSGGTLLFLYHLYHHYMYHQRLEAFCATDPTSISTNQSQKVFGK